MSGYDMMLFKVLTFFYFLKMLQFHSFINMYLCIYVNEIMKNQQQLINLSLNLTFFQVLYGPDV